MNNHSKYIYILLYWFISLSCRDRNIDVLEPSNLYPTLKIGQIKEYSVDEITVVLGIGSEERYYLKDVITDTLRFDTELYFVKLRYKKRTLLEQWNYLETVFEYQNENGVFEKYDNIHLQKVGYPVSFSTTWKINQRSESSKNNTAKYLDFKLPYTIGNETNNDAYSVQIINDSTGVHNFQEIEHYSPKYGLIYSLKKTILYCQDSKECLGKGVEESKKISTKKLTNFNP